MVPPHNNKYYIFDISPGKSLVEFCVANGFQVFAVSWCCAEAGQKGWGLDSYVQALEQAIDAACQITGSKDINIIGGCSGSLTVSALAGHLAARGEEKINSLTLLVSMLDMTGFRDTPFGLFISREILEGAKAGAKMGINLEGRTMGYLFAALRPNDLIWDFWINNYLLGNDPMAFDLLYWSNDFSDMPAGLHSDFLDMSINNPLVKSGSLTVCGTPIDLKKVTYDVCAIGGTSDHITPWQGCYRSMLLFGGKTEFILAKSGHVQSLLSSPNYPNARYYINDSNPKDPDAFLAGATEHAGSWWKPGARWLAARSGGKKPAPKQVGSRKHPALEAAPGTYVHGTHEKG
jgi:polyhydroxyalkanoate synthase